VPATAPTAAVQRTDPWGSIVRADNQGQNDPNNPGDRLAEEAPVLLQPQTAAEASWAALVQALYGSADFQFLR
jgi:hypothetical protein